MRNRLRNESGFTLVELMVVVLIIAILIAIAVPTFLGARTRAQDRLAQSNLRNALMGEKVLYTDLEAFTASIPVLDITESGVTWVAIPPSGPREIFVRIDGADDQVVCLEALSETESTWVLAEVANAPGAGIYFGSAALATCTRATASALSPTSW